MQTLKQICSDLASDLKAYTLDDKVSFRYLASKFRDHISYFLRQDSRSRELVKEQNIWKPINCVELADINPASCGIDLNLCKNLKKSIIEIPESYSTSYGPLVKVFTIDNLVEFTFIKSIDFKDYFIRKFKTNKKVFWLENKHIFVPDTEIEKIKVYIIPKDPSEVDKINGDKDICASPLDSELSYPDYLIKIAKQEVLKELLAGYKQIKQDERTDDNTNKK